MLRFQGLADSVLPAESVGLAGLTRLRSHAARQLDTIHRRHRHLVHSIGHAGSLADHHQITEGTSATVH